MPVTKVEHRCWTWSGKTIQIGLDRLGKRGSDPPRATGSKLDLDPHGDAVSSGALSSTFTTVSIDWPGFGDRPKPFVDWRPEAYAAFLDHLVTRVVPKPFATCAAGHAATYVLAQAVAMPGLMGRLCLVAPTWRGPLPTMMGKRARPLRGLSTPLITRYSDRFSTILTSTASSYG